MGTVNSTTSPWLSNQTVTSAEGRLALSASWAKASGSGILAEGGVIESSTPPTATVSGTNINVTAHQAIVEATGGTYVGTTTGTLAVPLQTPLPTAGQSRIDLIVAQIADSADSAIFQLASVTGTAAGSPSVPSVPANTTVLFQLTVTNTAPQPPTQRYRFTRPPGGIRLAEVGDVTAGTYSGEMRRFRNGQIDVWRTSGTPAWDPVAAPSAWTQFTPQLFASVTGAIPLGSGGTAIGRYIVQGKVMHLRYIFRADTQANGFNGGNGDVSTRLPSGYTSAPAEETQILAKLNAHLANGGLQGIFLGKCYIPASSTVMNLYMPVSSANCGLHTYMVSNGGAAGSGFPTIPGDFPRPAILVIQGTIEIT